MIAHFKNGGLLLCLLNIMYVTKHHTTLIAIYGRLIPICTPTAYFLGVPFLLRGFQNLVGII